MLYINLEAAHSHVFNDRLKFSGVFIGFFRFYNLDITLVNYWFQATGHSFPPRNVIFGLREHCTIFLKIYFFTLKWGSFYHFSPSIYQYNFGDS